MALLGGCVDRLLLFCVFCWDVYWWVSCLVVRPGVGVAIEVLCPGCGGGGGGVVAVLSTVL